jgi:hypothetical protein
MFDFSSSSSSSFSSSTATKDVNALSRQEKSDYNR